MEESDTNKKKNKKMRWRRRNKIVVRRVLGGDNSTRPINGQQQICQWNTFQTTLETILFIGATNGLIGSRHNRSFISFFFLLLFLLYFFSNDSRYRELYYKRFETIADGDTGHYYICASASSSSSSSFELYYEPHMIWWPAAILLFLLVSIVQCRVKNRNYSRWVP